MNHLNMKLSYKSSTPNSLIKSESTCIFLLNVFSATNPSTTVFSSANLSANIPPTIDT